MCQGETVSAALDRVETKTLIEAAHPIALEIDRDVLVTDGPDLADDPGANFRLERARQFVAGDLESGQRRR